MSLRLAMIGDYAVDPEQLTGGVQAVMRYLTDALAEDPQLDIHLVTLQARPRVPVLQRRPNLTIHYLQPNFRFANLTFFVVNKLKLLRRLRQIQPDLVHAHMAGTFAEVMHLSGRPGVLTAHGVRFLEPAPNAGWLTRFVRQPLIRRQELSSVRATRHLIAISPYIVEAYGPAVRGQVHHIENPIPDLFFSAAQSAQPGRLLFVGTLEERKAVHHLIEALAQIKPLGPEVRLRLAGSARLPAYEQKLRALTRQHQLEAHVEFLGRLNDAQLAKEYAQCAAVVLPSRQETAPMSIQQGMAAGKPIVATRVGGVPHLVAHRHTGLLTEFGNVPELAEALSWVLANPAAAQAMGQAGRAEAERRFRASTVAQRTQAVYQHILAQGGQA